MMYHLSVCDFMYFAALGLCAAASGADRYVNPTGSDTNPGTNENPIFRMGDLILAVNGRPVKNIDPFNKLISSAERLVRFKVIRNQQEIELKASVK